MKKFHLVVASPDGAEYEDNVNSLLIRTAEGDLEILADHTELCALVGNGGRVRILKDGEARFAACSGGILSVTREGVSLACTTFELAEDIDAARAKRAKKKAEEKLKASLDQRTEAIFKSKLYRAITRINVSELSEKER